MALIAGNMQGQPGVPPQAQADQRTVDRVVMAATKALNTPNVESQVLQLIKGQDPAQGLASALVYLMKALYEKSQGSMAALPKMTLALATKQVLFVIVKMAISAGIKIAPDVVKQALMLAAKMIQQQGSAQPPAPPAAPQQPAAQPAAPQPGV